MRFFRSFRLVRYCRPMYSALMDDARMDITRQLDAVDTLLNDAEVLPATLEVELHLYRERLATAAASR